MNTLSEEAHLVIIQLFLDESVLDGTAIHPKKKEKKKGGLTKELQQLIQDYTDLDCDIDLTPYKEAETFLLNLSVGEPYNTFIDSLLRPYMN